jgi:hypothetical protein
VRGEERGRERGERGESGGGGGGESVYAMKGEWFIAKRRGRGGERERKREGGGRGGLKPTK